MKFDDILAKYRRIAFSERDKGDRFERLMRAYLLSDPLYANRFTDVWLWMDFPFRKDFGGKDTGIDLVARLSNGDYWAIQCKCYAADATIDKPAVDSFLATSSKTFLNDELKTVSFAHRLWISTTNHWNREAENTIRGQNPAVSKVSLSQLQEAPVNWEKLEKGISGEHALVRKNSIKPHQQTALDKAHEHFALADRGKMIMACGTGKTFTALRIAENETQGKGTVLFLVPSIALLGQALREWSAQALEPINAICICSDAKVSRRTTKNDDTGGISVEDLALPASTDIRSIIYQVERFRNVEASGASGASGSSGMTVVFSTYQSIDVVSKAQKALKTRLGIDGTFDLVICDEAHRTTGVTLAEDDESEFVKIHDNDFIQAKKRLYMTATPRLFSDESKSRAKELDAVLCSMDDVAIYGDEFYRLGFGEAVEKSLLSDYKVLVLTLLDSQIPPALQRAIANGDSEINTDDASKLIGCINALSKRMLVDADLLKASDPDPMRRGVAFCQSIKVSKQITSIFNSYKDAYYESLDPAERATVVNINSDHIDGTMAMDIRDEKLTWLKSAPPSGTECRILTNVRCLSEGVDVPSLDAVLFLSPRNSQIDVVQSVGRVMRRAEGKKYGYIIIPVVVPSKYSAEETLNENERFKVVWTVLNALRAHDDRFNAIVNKIELNKNKANSTVLVGGIPDFASDAVNDSGTPYSAGDNNDLSKAVADKLALQFDELQSVIYARMVQKVGSRRYWEQWANDVASIAQRNIERINNLIAKDPLHRKAFEKFLSGLRKNINPSIDQQNAVEMLSQHIITKPVFEALFENYSFVKNNPISISMQKMLDLLEEQAVGKDLETLDRFYDSVRQRAEGIDNAEGKQRIIVELYDKFFKSAFPQTVEKLGIVYTPVEVVDFIIHSVSDILQKEFGRSISDENVHVLDPFTGTGTFITRLLQSGLIRPEALKRKYNGEFHANEIVLLAYYIASINIENAYHDLMPPGTAYQAFNGICLTDTFQLGESDENEHLFSEMFPQNSARVIAQRKAPIRVIIGNPPYQGKQESANDNTQNQPYPVLDKRVSETYVANSISVNKNSLYDPYIKAFRWASDRLDPKHGGIIAFVSNGAWLDGNATSGFRNCLEKEFTAIYVFNLRGNCRSSGDFRRREAGNVFGLGSRTPIAITLLVKNPATTGKRAVIHYRDIGDYLSREEKLKLVSDFKSIASPELALQTLSPNTHGDWLNVRDDKFATFIPVAPDQKNDSSARSVFSTYSRGLETSRDAWVYNFSRNNVERNMRRMIGFYNSQVASFLAASRTESIIDVDGFIDKDSTKIAWTRGLKKHCTNGTEARYIKSCEKIGIYRPFTKQYAYVERQFNEYSNAWSSYYPSADFQNLVICVSGVGGNKPHGILIVNQIADVNILDAGTQCFPLYYYDKNDTKERSLFDNSDDEYIRRDGVSDFILEQARISYGPKVKKEDVFYFVYGLLHSPDYRTRYSSDLKKMLPRIPLVEEPKMFWAFSKAGRDLAQWHLNYETVEPYPVKETKTRDNFVVEQMRFGKVGKAEDKSTILYNASVTLSGIPLEAYDYIVNGKSAIEWLMERYAVTTHKESGIRNDPNDWAKEQGDPRYILDLVKRIIRVSLETVAIVKTLPPLPVD